MLNRYSVKTYHAEAFGIDTANAVTSDVLAETLHGVPANKDIAIYSLWTGELVRTVETYAEAWAAVASGDGLYFYE